MIKNSTFCFLSSLIFLAIGFESVKGQTYVSGGIYTNTTWTFANSPYIVTDTIVLFPGVTLTIAAGVTVKFNDSTRMEVRQATLTAMGNGLNSIKFTSNSVVPHPGSWNGIFFNGNGLAQTSSFNYCILEYAQTGIQSAYYNLNISNSIFTQNNVAIDYEFGFLQSGFSLQLNKCDFNSNNTGITGYNSSVFADSCNFYNSDSGIDGVGMDFSFTYCNFKDNITGVYSYGGGETALINCIVSRNQTGISFENLSTIIKNCIIDSNSVDGLYFMIGNGDSVINSRFSYNGVGYRSSGSGIHQTTFSENIFEYNDIGVKVEDYPDIMRCNKFCNNLSYDLYYMSQYNFSFKNNYWCSFDSIMISSNIYDGYDNFNYGPVSFMPFDTTECYLINDISLPNSNFQSSVFPNPVSDVLNVSVTNNEENEFRLYDLESRLIFDQSFFNKISISSLKFLSGLYIYEIVTRNELLKRGKIVIDRN